MRLHVAMNAKGQYLRVKTVQTRITDAHDYEWVELNQATLLLAAPGREDRIDHDHKWRHTSPVKQVVALLPASVEETRIVTLESRNES